MTGRKKAPVAPVTGEEKGTLLLGERSVPYMVKRSMRRRRSYGFVVTEGVVVFSAPRWVRLAELLGFAERRRRFIEKRLGEQAKARAVADERALRKADLEGRWCELPVEWYRRAARPVMVPRVQHWAKKVGVSVGSVRITSGRTVWGSCSSAGNISLSWRLLLVPEALREYVIIHEICHRVHLNHGVRFWRLVEKFCPDYEEKRRMLNGMGGDIG